MKYSKFAFLLAVLVTSFAQADVITLDNNSCICILAGQNKCLDEKNVSHEFDSFVSMCAGTPATVIKKHYFSDNTKSIVLEYETKKSAYKNYIMAMLSFDVSLSPSLSEKAIKDTLDYHSRNCLPKTNDEDFCNSLAKRISSLEDIVPISRMQ